MAVRGPAAADSAAEPGKAAKQTPPNKVPQKKASKPVKAAKTATGSSDVRKAPLRPVAPQAQPGSGDTQAAVATSRGCKRRRQPAYADTDLSPEEIARRAHQRKRRVCGT